MQKDLHIKALSEASDESGNLLLEMMDFYKADGLKDLSEDQVAEFYEKKLSEMK